jgi:hypothetical protein
MFPHAASSWIAYRRWFRELLATPAAETLVRLYRTATLIAEHDSSWFEAQKIPHEIRSVARRRSNPWRVGAPAPPNMLVKNEKAARQLGWPFLSRENSSNGDQTVKTFWRNLMSRKRGVSRNFS